MANLISKLSLNSENSTFIMSGLMRDDILVNYSSDIDFTPLVTVLTELIDTVDQIDFDFENLSALSEKESLVLNALKDIFNSYNECISTDDLPISPTPVFNSPDEDDLPF